MINLKGVGVALITPFTEKGDVDFAALERLLNYVKTSGVNYLVVFGTTGEPPTLTSAEKSKILKFIKEWNKGAMPIVLGMGSNNTAELCEQIESTDFTDISAILSVTPYYNKPTNEGLYQHFKLVAEKSPVPVIVYNVPSRTGVNMSAQTTLRLANTCPNIIGIKEASGNINQAAYIIKDAPETFFVISGDDNLTLPMIALGADGVISVAANAFASDFCQMVNAALNDDMVIARSKYYKLLAATDTLFEEGNPAGVKCALSIKKITTGAVRLPLVKASDNVKNKLQQEINKYKI